MWLVMTWQILLNSCHRLWTVVEPWRNKHYIFYQWHTPATFIQIRNEIWSETPKIVFWQFWLVSFTLLIQWTYFFIHTILCFSERYITHCFVYYIYFVTIWCERGGNHANDGVLSMLRTILSNYPNGYGSVQHGSTISTRINIFVEAYLKLLWHKWYL